MRPRRAPLLALCAATALAVPCAGAAAVFVPSPSGGRTALNCPDALGEFRLTRAAAGACAYAAAGEATATLSATPDDDAGAGATVAAPQDLPGWRGRVLHLGETDDRDGRLEIWTAQPPAAPLVATVRYAIPGFAPRSARAFVQAAGAANGVMEDVEPDAGPACAESLAGLALARSISDAEGGASVHSACVYAGERMSASVNQTLSMDAAMEDFAASLGAAEPADGPRAGTRSRVVFTEGGYRGVWTAMRDGAAIAVEADWTSPDEAAAIQALLDAVF